MEIVKVEYVTETSEAIYCNVTLKKNKMNWYGKISVIEETSEVYLRKSYSGLIHPFPEYSKNGKWVDNGYGTTLYESLRALMLRARAAKGIVNI